MKYTRIIKNFIKQILSFCLPICIISPAYAWLKTDYPMVDVSTIMSTYGCELVFVSPNVDSYAVVTNADVVVRWSRGPNDECGALEVLEEDALGEKHVLEMTPNYNRNWNARFRRSPIYLSPLIDSKVVHEVSLHPEKNFDPEKRYWVRLGEQILTSFTVNSSAKVRGEWLAVQPAIPDIWGVLPAQDEIPNEVFRNMVRLHVANILSQDNYWESLENHKNRNLQLHSDRIGVAKEKGTSLKKRLLLDVVSSNLPHLYNPHDLSHVRFYRLIYQTQDPWGNAQEESALLAIPFSPDMGVSLPYEKLPLMMLEHTWPVTNTTPSKGNSLETIVAGLLASRGFIVIAPDHLGLGRSISATSNRFIGRGLSVDSYDALQATRSYFQNQFSVDLNPNLWISGGSKGSTNALHFFEYALNREEKIDNFYGYAGPYDYYGMTYSMVRAVLKDPISYDPFSEYALPDLDSQADDFLEYMKGAIEYDNVEQAFWYNLRDPDSPGFFHKPALRDLVNLAYPNMHYHVVMNSFSDIFSTTIPAGTNVWLYHPKRDPFVSFYNTITMTKKFVAHAQDPDSIHQGNCRDYSALTLGLYALALWKNNDLIKHLQCYGYVIEDIFARFPNHLLQ